MRRQQSPKTISEDLRKSHVLLSFAIVFEAQSSHKA